MESEKLQQLRQLLKQKQLDGVIIPHADCHQSEYLAAKDEIIQFISGFSGSNGICLVTSKEAILWTDSRYYLAAEKQLQPGWKMMKMEAGQQTYYEYIATNYSDIKIAVSAANIRAYSFKFIQKHLEKTKIILEATDDLIETIWKDRPGFPNNLLSILELKYSGKSYKEKREEVWKKVQSQADVYVNSKLDDIAWLLNLRGTDIICNPVFFSFLVLQEDKTILFVNKEAIDSKVEQYLQENAVSVMNYDGFYDYLKTVNNKKVYVNEQQINYQIYKDIDQNDNQIVNGNSIIEYLKTIKNETEIKGMIECHKRDAVAMAIAFSYLEDQLQQGAKISEYQFAQYINQQREKQKDSKGISFDTISSTGSNAAIIHYKPSEDDCQEIKINQIFLCDSGGQYLDGTTDVTRTFYFDKNEENEELKEMRQNYTRVLLGNLDLERIVFPNNGRIYGSHLDVLARRHLWESGLDYGHGTGHGVGSYLNVHEGPQGISLYSQVGLQSGMVVSDEPGYYKDGHYGIRIENLIIVQELMESKYLGFMNLTLCPYDSNLIDKTMLSNKDIEYINRYHQTVYEQINPLLQEQTQTQAQEWLKQRTQPL